MNKDNIDKWFHLIKDKMEICKTWNKKLGFDNPDITPSEVYNIDETWLQLYSARNIGIVRKGAKTTHRRTQTSQELVTSINAVCGDGKKFTPFYILKGQKANKDKMKKAKSQVGSCGKCLLLY